MVISIAIGVMLGFVFLALAVLAICLISAVIVRAQDKIDNYRPVRTRIRPEADNYERMQELKRRAAEDHPERWGRRKDAENN